MNKIKNKICNFFAEHTIVTLLRIGRKINTIGELFNEEIENKFWDFSQKFVKLALRIEKSAR